MKTIINNLKTIFNNAITANTLNAKLVIKGFDNADPTNAPIEKFPFIAIEDGGERTEDGKGESTLIRIYSVQIFFAVLVANIETSLDNVLDLSDQVRGLIELEANKQYDGHIWGVNIIPVEGTNETLNKMWRGRQITVDFIEMEFSTNQDTYGDY